MLRAEQYRPLAAAAAARWGAYYGVTVPVDTVLAMVMKESSGNPAAKRTEPDGRISRGLLQVLEGTARELGLMTPPDLHTPAVGIDVGVHYFAKQLARYGGNAMHAIAAYNAGTAKVNAKGAYKNQGYVSAVLKWLEQFKSPGQATVPAVRADRLVPLALLGAAVFAVAGFAVRRRAAA